MPTLASKLDKGEDLYNEHYYWRHEIFYLITSEILDSSKLAYTIYQYIDIQYVQKRERKKRDREKTTNNHREVSAVLRSSVILGQGPYQWMAGQHR